MFYTTESATILKNDLLKEIENIDVSIFFEIQSEGEFLLFMIFINDENDFDKLDYIKITVKNYLASFLPSYIKGSNNKKVDFRWFVNIYFKDELLDVVSP